MSDIRHLPCALTFDDGPHHRITRLLLDQLDDARITATFFLVGRLANVLPEIVSETVERGHELGNHSWSHASLNNLCDEQLYEELSRTHECLLRLSGVAPKLFRPPYGQITKRQRQLVNEWFGYSTVLWNTDSQDWRRPGIDQIANSILLSKGKGSVILLHDTNLETVRGVARALADKHTSSQDFVTVTKLRELFECSGTPQI